MKNVEDIYPLSPTQEGMLFHSLYDSAEAGVYVGQMSYEVAGELDVPAFERAWQRVVDRHPALRTAFVWEGLDQPMQIVRQRVRIPFEQQDWQGLPAKIQQKWLASFLKTDRARGFDSTQAPLMRVAVLRVAAKKCYVIWSFHQMVMDGWSLPLITNEVTRFYRAFSLGREQPQPQPRPYRDYIEWLQKQDMAKAEAYWRQALRGFTAPTQWGLYEPLDAPAESYGEREVQLSRQTTDALNALARQNRMTLNTAVQGAWALLLSRYSGDSDVVFGATMSGRPEKLDGVEDMVGMFITTLPVRVAVSPGEPVVSWLQKLLDLQVEMRQYEYSPLVDVQKWSDVTPGRPLFENILVFENYPQMEGEEAPPEQAAAAAADGIMIANTRVAEQANYPLALGVQMVPEVVLRLNYDGSRFDRSSIARMLGHLQGLLEGFARSADRSLGAVPLLTESELHQVLVEWNDTAVAAPDRRPAHRLIAEQAARTPVAVALAFESESLTYRELDERANRLARHLLGLGIDAGALIGVALERSLDTAVAILGIWKAGAVYVPLDPGYPRERLAFMMEDSGISALLTEAPVLERLPPTAARAVRLSAEHAAIAACSPGDPGVDLGPDALAYLIYTSGTTGRPKAVMVEHGNLMATLESSRRHFRFGAGDLMPHLAPFSFDISLFELLNPLLTGGTSLILTRQHILDLPRFAAGLEQATLLHAVPSLMRQILTFLAAEEWTEREGPHGEIRLRGIFLGGDAVPADLLAGAQAAFPNAQVHVLYGPTETAIICTSHAVPREEKAALSLIGRPLDNVELRLLDRDGGPVPIGVPGEIWVGGDGVARGYLDRPELTAERFARLDGRRFYRTGDLARFRPDGNLEFLGRIDHQVKIRGFRVELGEVEAVLGRLPGVREAAVAARGGDDKRLVAYVVAEPGRIPTSAELRQGCQGELPDYMVPAAFVFLDALPLTPAGKVDRVALPAPDGSRPDREASFVSPRNRTEETLASIWAELLAVEKVGVHDDFFSLGGDSIGALKAVGKANRLGLRFSPKQLFENPTIAALATVVSEAPRIKVEKGVVQGPAPLTPFQRAFLDSPAPEHQHWNESVLVQVPPGVEPFLVNRVLEHALRHHDALRLRFTREEAGWKQTGTAPDAKVPLVQVDLSALPEGVRTGAIEAAASEFQGSLDLARGPLLRLALFTLGAGLPGRMLLAAHRLVADRASLDIVLEDLERGYQQLDSGEAISLPPKATSFKYWAERLLGHARSAELLAELPYWLAAARRRVPALPVDFPGGASTVATARRVTVSLSSEESRAFFQEAVRAYRTRPGEVVLAALASAVSRRTGGALLVTREIQGRDRFFPDVDVLRTVGQLTATYPLLLETGGLDGEAALLKAVKEQARAVPGSGLGHSLLLALTGAPEAAPLRDLPAAQILFVDRTGDRGRTFVSLFTAAPEDRGADASPSTPRSHVLELECEAAGDRLSFHWTYSEGLHRRETIDDLAAAHLGALRELAAHCLSPEAGGYTPSDFPLARLGQAALDRLAGGNRGIEDIYPLAPLQEGMLFHTLFAPTEGMYISQVSCQLEGILDVPALHRAWQEVVDRHPILRTWFVVGELDRPLQVVQESAAVPLDLQDWTAVPKPELKERVREALAADRERGFDITRPPLVRLTLLKLGPELHQLIWTCHHALLDAWCQSMIFQEVTAFYEAYRQGKQRHLPRPRPYRDYIEWLGKQDLRAAEEFWRRALAGFTAATPLAVERLVDTGFEGGAERSLRLGAEESDQLNALARGQRMTLNTLVQGAWALLLSRYSRQSDVVFGITVAGRPPELEGSDEMIGLFINTLPMRAQVPAEDPLAPWLRKFQDRQIELRQYEYTPLADLQRWSEVAPGDPLFENILVFQNVDREKAGEAPEAPAEKAEQPPPSLRIRGLSTSERSNYPVTAGMYGDKNLILNLSYDRALLDEATIKRMLGHWAALLCGFLADEEVRLGQLSLLGEAERHQVAVEWGDAAPAAAVPPVPVLLAARALSAPHETALAAGADRMTHGELDRRTNQLAHHLRRIGVAWQQPVAVFLERSAASAVACLAIWKAGGIYVPLDTGHPAERLSFLLEDAAPAAVLTTAELDRSLPAAPSGPLRVRLDADAAAIAACPESALPEAVTTDSLAYMIYTSGTTGRPKAVLVGHDNLAAAVVTGWCRLGFAAGDVMAHLAPFSFDISLFELLGPLVVGGSCLIVPREEILDLDKLVRRLSEVTCFHAVPSLLRQILNALRQAGEAGSLPRLRKVFTGGERVPLDLLEEARRAFAPAEVVVLYGPTEATVLATSFAVPAEGKLARTVIGRPLDGVALRLLDPDGREVPVGVPGEIYLGGAGVTRGYHLQEALTQEKYTELAGCRFYRTGDLARHLPDGNIQFLGRIDQQVKIRGFRIEPGEIEAVLRSHPAVEDVVVVAWEEPAAAGAPGEPRLVGYVVPAPLPEGEEAKGPRIRGEELRDFASRLLPDYMVPRAFYALKAIPLLPNGKLNRRALPAPDGGRADAQAEYLAPRTPTEEVLAGIWAQVLGLDRVGAGDNFFALGGHSLLATQVASRLRRAFAAEVPLAALFEAPTLAGLAGRIDEAVQSSQGTLAPPIVPVPHADGAPLSFAQERAWLLHRLLPGDPSLNLNQPLRFRGILDLALAEHTMGQILRRHEVLRTSFELVDGELRQRAGAVAPFRFPLVDLGDIPEELHAAEVSRLAIEEARRPFDLGSGPLLRGPLLRLAYNDHIFLMTIHHIAADGWSMGLLLNELTRIYRATANGREPQVPELPVQYADYAVWQREWWQGEVLAAQLAYWQDRLAGAPALLTLPLDRPRAPQRSSSGDRRSLALPRDLTAALKVFTRAEGVTLFMALLAPFQALLGRYAGQGRISVGTPSSGRDRQEVEPLIGFFVNTLVLCTDVSGAPTFRELLRRARETALGSYSHPIPFEKLVAELQPPRSLGHTPLFQVMFSVPAAQGADRGDHDLALSLLDDEAKTVMFDLSLQVLEDGEERFVPTLAYSTQLFDEATAGRLLRDFEAVLRALAADPDSSPAEVVLLSAGEQRQLTAPTPAPPTPLPAAPALFEVWEPQRAGDPARPAQEERPYAAEDTGPGAPLDPLEGALAALWRELLGAPAVGLSDDFFASGGHSMLAVRLVARIEEETGHRLPLLDLFAAPTLGGMAGRIRERAAGEPFNCLVPLRPGGAQPPLFLIHAADGRALSYGDLAERLDPGVPVYGLQAADLDRAGGSSPSVEQTAARYLGEILRACPAGPYRLAGWSLGGAVAFELARRLRRQGREVAFLGLLDARLPQRDGGQPAGDPPAPIPGKVVYYEASEAGAGGEAPAERGALARAARFLSDLVRPQAAPSRAWEPLATGGLIVRSVPGDHFTILRSPHVEALARRLSLDLQDSKEE